MKTCFSSFLALAFLLPAIASAGSYCVSFPTGGESKWSKRDNSINVRFKYRYNYDWVRRNFKEIYLGEPPPDYSTGVLKGSGGKNRIKAGYTSYRYRADDLCVDGDDAAPDFGRLDALRREGITVVRNAEGTVDEAPLVSIHLDVKWGGDCGRVRTRGDGSFGGDHKFEIYRRKGNHIDPFGCRRKK